MTSEKSATVPSAQHSTRCSQCLINGTDSRRLKLGSSPVQSHSISVVEFVFNPWVPLWLSPIPTLSITSLTSHSQLFVVHFTRSWQSHNVSANKIKCKIKLFSIFNKIGNIFKTLIVKKILTFYVLINAGLFKKNAAKQNGWYVFFCDLNQLIVSTMKRNSFILFS